MFSPIQSYMLNLKIQSIESCGYCHRQWSTAASIVASRRIGGRISERGGLRDILDYYARRIDEHVDVGHTSRASNGRLTANKYSYRDHRI